MIPSPLGAQGTRLGTHSRGPIGPTGCGAPGARQGLGGHIIGWAVGPCATQHMAYAVDSDQRPD